jgi:hypothetical protein
MVVIFSTEKTNVVIARTLRQIISRKKQGIKKERRQQFCWHKQGKSGRGSHIS